MRVRCDAQTNWQAATPGVRAAVGVRAARHPPNEDRARQSSPTRRAPLGAPPSCDRVSPPLSNIATTKIALCEKAATSSFGKKARPRPSTRMRRAMSASATFGTVRRRRYHRDAATDVSTPATPGSEAARDASRLNMAAPRRKSSASRAQSRGASREKDSLKRSAEPRRAECGAGGRVAPGCGVCFTHEHAAPAAGGGPASVLRLCHGPAAQPTRDSHTQARAISPLTTPSPSLHSDLTRPRARGSACRARGVA